jgi:hypothetical protein
MGLLKSGTRSFLAGMILAILFILPAVSVLADPNDLPNEPADPNEPEDPNFPGFNMMQMNQTGFVPSTDDCGLTTDNYLAAQQLQENIDFLYQAAADEPDAAASMYEFIGTLEQELWDIYGTLPGYDFTQ